MPARLHPRTFDDGAYKPIITHGLGGLLAKDITSGFWKVDFNAYERRVLAASHAYLSDYLFGNGEWKSSAFVSEARARRLWERLQHCPNGGKSMATEIVSAVRVLGLETWLRNRAARDEGTTLNG